MSQIVKGKSSVFAAITDKTDYVKARKEADKLAVEHGLRVADMPMVIQAMTTHPKVRKAIRSVCIDTITGEYHGQRDGDSSYEVWHSVGSLATAEGLEKVFPEADEYAFMTDEYTFMKVVDDEWVAVGNGNYNGQNVARVHLDDAKKGNVPTAGTPYTVFTRLDKANINGSGQLTYDAFMSDDRVLMIAGSPDNREALAKMLFGRKEEGGECWSSIGSVHTIYNKINKAGFDAQAKGCLVYLAYQHYGLGSYEDIDLNGCFVGRGRFIGVGAGGAVAHEKSAPQSIVQPTLEQTLTVINNPDLNRQGMAKAISQLYKRLR